MSESTILGLLGPETIAEILGKSTETIVRDHARRPQSLPPSLRIPGSRLLRWRREDVEAWLADLEVRQPAPTAQVHRRGRPTKTEQRARARGAA